MLAASTDRDLVARCVALNAPTHLLYVPDDVVDARIGNDRAIGEGNSRWQGTEMTYDPLAPAGQEGHDRAVRYARRAHQDDAARAGIEAHRHAPRAGVDVDHNAR